jgi:hypothetical protein
MGFEYKRMVTDEQINKTVFYKKNKKDPYTKTWQTVERCDVR